MSKLYRRFEILLPLRFNDGNAVPKELVVKTIDELRQRFGAISFESQIIQGVWTQETEEMTRVFVDSPDSAETREFFVSFKERLEERFQQDAIWITTHAVEVL
jgi:hypothetical protein